MAYRCVASGLTGFVQQVATAYVPHGYWFYSQGFVPEGKAVGAVDEKLIAKYGVAMSKWQRARRKRLGQANVQYIRLGRIFLLMATKGRHDFFEAESAAIRDLRKTPIKVGGYSISARKGSDGHLHTHVRIDRDVYVGLEARLTQRAGAASRDWLTTEFYSLPFEPYAPVRRQYLVLLKRVNEVRSRHGRERLPYGVLPFRRRIVQPFAEQCDSACIEQMARHSTGAPRAANAWSGGIIRHPVQGQ